MCTMKNPQHPKPKEYYVIHFGRDLNARRSIILSFDRFIPKFQTQDAKVMV